MIFYTNITCERGPLGEARYLFFYSLDHEDKLSPDSKLGQCTVEPQNANIFGTSEKCPD